PDARVSLGRPVVVDEVPGRVVAEAVVAVARAHGYELPERVVAVGGAEVAARLAAAELTLVAVVLHADDVADRVEVVVVALQGDAAPGGEDIREPQRVVSIALARDRAVTVVDLG